ncbi:MAG: hypothetical protein CML68_15880 [Rhodobacteraceae bacterium]|nr:hypothetical protein [Paracoccaceae bacterium]
MLPERRSVFDLRTVLAILGGVMLTVLMGLTVVDVIGRYVFNAPLKGASEMTELLLAAIIFMGLPAVSLADQHVTVDLVTDKLPNWIQPARKVLIGLFSAAILVLVGWRIWVYAAQIGGYGGSTTTLHIPLAPVGYFCAACTFVGAFLSLVVPVWHLVRSPKD